MEGFGHGGVLEHFGEFGGGVGGGCLGEGLWDGEGYLGEVVGEWVVVDEGVGYLVLLLEEVECLGEDAVDLVALCWWCAEFYLDSGGVHSFILAGVVLWCVGGFGRRFGVFVFDYQLKF